MTPDPAAIFGRLDLESRTCVLVALSGGSDSTALLVLLCNHLSAIAAAPRILAVTVDHGLRPESAGEAVRVAALCQRLGVDHRILRWTGAKPKTGIIAAAREARYDLLARAARDAGAELVLTGHTMDDQAETVAMRAQRGDGVGLAGMADATLFDGAIWIVRPLLGLRRQALRDKLGTWGIGWIDEPSNDNAAFERVRVRQSLDEDAIEVLSGSAAEAGDERARLAGEAAAFLTRHAVRPQPGLFRLDHPGEGRSDATTLLALRSLLGCAGGTTYLPDRGRAQALLDRLAAGERLRVALSRALVDARRTGIWIRRETRNLPTMSLSRGTTIWDGRWRVSCDTSRDGLSVGAIGAEDADAMSAAAGETPTSLVRATLAAEPGLFDGARPIGRLGSEASREHGVAAHPVVAPYARFLPGFDLELAAALNRLIGAAELPARPWKKHIAGRP